MVLLDWRRWISMGNLSYSIYCWRGSLLRGARGKWWTRVTMLLIFLYMYVYFLFPFTVFTRFISFCRICWHNFALLSIVLGILCRNLVSESENESWRVSFNVYGTWELIWEKVGHWLRRFIEKMATFWHFKTKNRELDWTHFSNVANFWGNRH